MSAIITTPFGVAVPPAPPHSVTVHMSDWTNMERFGADPAATIAKFQNAYPRMKLHKHIVELIVAVLDLVGARGQGCFLFASLQSATECVAYATSPLRDDGSGKKPIPLDRISIRAFTANDRFFAVIFPPESTAAVIDFWTTPGVGISSRFAEANLSQLTNLTEIEAQEDSSRTKGFDSTAHAIIRQRIVDLIKRAPLSSSSPPILSVKDVYLFPSGMASIYKPHTYLLSARSGTTVLFGMAFLNTLAAFRDFGSGCRFFGLGTDEDMGGLQEFLQLERDNGRTVQAIWAEFPANPLLVTPDIKRLRGLADQYDTVLVIDDTIGSWANIDILQLTDMLVTSLTKSFNGYANAIGGSVILNPTSRKYHDLKALFDRRFIPELYTDDAEVLDQNSRDYLVRTTILNRNAETLVNYLNSCANNPDSAVRRVHYPSINHSGQYYREFMRPGTNDFAPGYGCLFSVELEDMPTTISFHDNLNVHKGPHFGAPFTLAYAYTMCAYKQKLDWAAQNGLRPTQLRIAAGMEDTATLLEDFRIAVEAADRVKKERTSKHPSETQAMVPKKDQEQ